jgi:hypothetical protein
VAHEKHSKLLVGFQRRNVRLAVLEEALALSSVYQAFSEVGADIDIF